MAESDRYVDPDPVLSRAQDRYNLLTSLDWHQAESQRKLVEAKARRGENHGLIQSALGGGAPEAMAGPAPQGSNDEEALEQPGRSRRFQAWRKTISDFRRDPTD